MQEVEFAFMLELWNEILQRFRMTSKALQDEKIALSTCSNLFESLEKYLEEVRNKFDYYETKAKEKLPEVDYRSRLKRKITRKRQVDEGNAPDTQLSDRDTFRVSAFLPVIDALSLNLRERATIYKKIAGQFGFLTKLDMPDQKRKKATEKLIKVYFQDIDVNLIGELSQFHAYVQAKVGSNERVPSITHQELYKIIIQDGLQCVFPNTEVILRLFLTLMVTNCSGERSFSQLKRIKNELRTGMSQNRLTSLSLLCIEREKLREIDFEDVIDDFAVRKSRKKMFKK
jgi:hypothetical protein